MTMCGELYTTPSGHNVTCTLQRGHVKDNGLPHAAMPTGYRWFRDGAGYLLSWVENEGESPITAAQHFANLQRDPVSYKIGPARSTADYYADNTPCGAGGTFNNDSVYCSRDHGHFGPHRAILHDNGYNVFQGPNLGPRLQHKLAVIWESR